MEWIRKIEVKIRYFFWALSRVDEIHLSDTVQYNGFLCSVINGVSAPRWKLLPLHEENLKLEKRLVYDSIHQDEFVLRLSYKDYIRRIKQDYQFQMRSWFSIDVNRPLFRRISFKSKNDIRF